MVDVIRKYTGTKTINGRKYLSIGLFATLKEAEKSTKEDYNMFVTKIFKLEDGKTKYPYRVYIRKPINVYDERAGRVVLKK